VLLAREKIEGLGISNTNCQDMRALLHASLFVVLCRARITSSSGSGVLVEAVEAARKAVLGESFVGIMILIFGSSCAGVGTILSRWGVAPDSARAGSPIRSKVRTQCLGQVSSGLLCDQNRVDTLTIFRLW